MHQLLMRRLIAALVLAAALLITALTGRAAAIPGWNGCLSRPHICLDDVVP